MHRVNEIQIGREKRSTETSLCTTNPIWTALGLNPALRGGPGPGLATKFSFCFPVCNSKLQVHAATRRNSFYRAIAVHFNSEI